MRRFVSSFAFCVLLAGCAASPHFQHPMAAVEPDVPAGSLLAGDWTPVDAQLGGNDFPVSGFGGTVLHMTEHSYEFAGDRGSYDVLSSGSPARMDIHGEQGPNAGRLIPVLYDLRGNQLTISYQLGPGVRPTDLASPAGSKILLVHYRRSH